MEYSVLQRVTTREILELSERPTEQEIKANYKRLIKKYHPDINKSPEALEYTKRLNVAYKHAMDIMEKIKQGLTNPQHAGIVVTVHYTYTNGSSSTGDTWTY